MGTSGADTGGREEVVFIDGNIATPDSWELELLDMFNRVAPIASSLGVKLSFDADRRAVVSWPYNASLISASRPHRQTGTVHGGMYAVVADTAGEEARRACQAASAHESQQAFGVDSA